MIHHSLKTLLDFFEFLGGVVFRLSNLFVGGAFGLFWVSYTQISGRNLPMPWFWGFLILFFLFAAFGAWREQWLKVEKSNRRRPDFQYSPDGSEIVPVYHRSMVRVRMNLRFTNRGEASACNTDGAIYGCWINDNPPTVFTDRGRSVGRTHPGERLHRSFSAWHTLEEAHQRAGHGDPYTLVLMYELQAHVNSKDGELFENEPIWLMWHPGLNDKLSWARPDDVATAEPHIAKFKQGEINASAASLPA